MLGTRAVLRPVEAGQEGFNGVSCAWCGERVKFRARQKDRQVLCNVYVAGCWDRVEHYHYPDCYDLAGQPYGPPVGTGDRHVGAGR